jgi:hypothetical protein
MSSFKSVELRKWQRRGLHQIFASEKRRWINDRRSMWVCYDLHTLGNYFALSGLR